MNSIARNTDGNTLPHAHCRFCDEDIVQAPEVGWLDPTPGDTYDVCPGSPYGDHEPSDARGDATRTLWTNAARPRR